MEMRYRKCISLNLKFLTHQQSVFLKFNFNINIYDVNDDNMRKSSFEFHMLHYFSVSQKQWNVCHKRVTKVTATEKRDKFSMKKQRFH